MAGSARLPRERVRTFWRARIAAQTIQEAAATAGVSQTGVERWIAESGGMIPADVDRPPGRRYLSLAEREEIADGWSAGQSKAEIARRVGRHRSTIGRELTRNQTRHRPPLPPRPDGQPHRPGPRPGTHRGQDRAQHERLRYRPALAQAKAEDRARRPKPTKLATHPGLTTEVQAGLTARWSPQQISRTLRRSYPDRPEMWVSH